MLPLIFNCTKDLSFFNKPITALFIFLPILMLIVQLLIFDLKLGIMLLAGLGLLVIALLKPVVLYMLVIASFSIEGFTAFPGLSLAKIGGIILAVALILRLVLRNESIPRDDSYKYFFLFFLGGLVSFATAINIFIGVQFYITYISLVILYVCARYFMKTEKHVYAQLDVLFIATIASLIYLYITTGGLISLRTQGVARFAGGIGDSNEYASYMLVLLPIAVYRAMNTAGLLQFLYSVCGLIFFAVLIFTGSRGGLLGLLGALAVFIQHYGIRKIKVVFVVLLLLSASIYIFLPEGYLERAATITEHEKKEDSRDTRIENYRIALNMFLDRPLAGFGLDNFQFASPVYGGKRGVVVHNSYLEILVGGGLLSFIPFLLILLNSWKKLKIKNIYEKHIRDLMVCLKASFVSILITSFFLTAGHKKILWFLLALISSVYYIAERQHKLGGNAPRMP